MYLMRRMSCRGGLLELDVDLLRPDLFTYLTVSTKPPQVSSDLDLDRLRLRSSKWSPFSTIRAPLLRPDPSRCLAVSTKSPEESRDLDLDRLCLRASKYFVASTTRTPSPEDLPTSLSPGSYDMLIRACLLELDLGSGGLWLPCPSPAE